MQRLTSSDCEVQEASEGKVAAAKAKKKKSNERLRMAKRQKAAEGKVAPTSPSLSHMTENC